MAFSSVHGLLIGRPKNINTKKNKDRSNFSKSHSSINEKRQRMDITNFSHIKEDNEQENWQEVSVIPKILGSDSVVCAPVFKEFQDWIKKECGSCWKETVLFKKRIGIDVNKFDAFLKNFLKQDGVSNSIIEKLQDAYIKNAQKYLETFAIKDEEGVGGQYGMIALLRGDEKFNLFYTIHSVKVSLPVEQNLSLRLVGLFENIRSHGIYENYIRGQFFQLLKNEGIIENISYVNSMKKVADSLDTKNTIST